MPDEDTHTTFENALVAEKLAELADLLEAQHASRFRVNAYRDAATYIQGLSFALGDFLATEGADALEALPTIGPSIASAIQEILRTGHLRMLDTLRGEVDPEKLFQTVPQIGPNLAERIHDYLGIDSLEALEIAAHDGRLAALPGFGPRRVKGIQYALAELLNRPRRHPDIPVGPTPPIALLLEVDRHYRRAAKAGELPVIQPRRFAGKTADGIPILHSEASGWHFTALFSNTLRAHRLHKTQDWVVISYQQGNHPSRTCTVVAEWRGALQGRRVVRGFETACAEYYART